MYAIATNVLGVVALSIISFAGTYFIPNAPIADLHQVAVVNHWMGIGFRIALFFAALDLIVQLGKYLRPRFHSTRLAF